MKNQIEFTSFSNLVLEITSLGLQNDSLARRMMTDACLIVRPVMIKYDLRIDSLQEFLPKSKRLLGMNTNRGKLIQIRLRVKDGSKNEYACYHAN